MEDATEDARKRPTYVDKDLEKFLLCEDGFDFVKHANISRGTPRTQDECFYTCQR